MESVASFSPSPSAHNIGRIFPSLEVARMYDASHCGRLSEQRKRLGNNKDDERDDAYGANKRVDNEMWNGTKRNEKHPIHEITFSGPPDQNRLGRLVVDARHRENHNRLTSSDWHHRRFLVPVRGTYRVQEENYRHPIGMVPVSQDEGVHSKPSPHPSSYTIQHGPGNYARTNPPKWSLGYDSSHLGYESTQVARVNSSRGGRQSSVHTHISRVIIPKNLVIPRALSSPSTDGTSRADESGKRSRDSRSPTPSPSNQKRSKKDSNAGEGSFEMLELLCSATLELGPLQENPAGCSCPKSKCIALYCDCFKAGRRCNVNTCTCLDCKNTIAESGMNGARSKVSKKCHRVLQSQTDLTCMVWYLKAIQSILARNPRAFTNAGCSKDSNKPSPGEQACNCIRSRCLKLYCTCFQAGKACNPAICSCVSCLNLEGDTTGLRQTAIETTLEKRPDAFKVKTKKKEIGSGCACKNNRCVRKYCECFRTGLSCTKKCCCRECENQAESDESV